MNKCNRIYLVALVAIAALLPASAEALDIHLVREFGAFDGSVDFLPGAWVSVWEDGKTKYYKYQNDLYTEANPPPNIRAGWTPFGGDYESADKIALTNYDPSINAYLPTQKKVKLVKTLITDSKKNTVLTLVCFTTDTTDPDAMRLSDVDIYVTALSGKKINSGLAYTKLWTKKIQSAVRYGEVSIQNPGELGRILIVYSESLGGSGYTSVMDVYKVDAEQ